MILGFIALAITYYFDGLTKSSKKIQLTGSCENIANSMVSYILKDEANLFVTSFGPDSGAANKAYPTGVNINSDGKDQFLFNGSALIASIPPIGVTNPYLSLTDRSITGVGSGIGNVTDATGFDGTTEGVPGNWRFNNRMNIRNSMTRLITLASDGVLAGICGQDIVLIDTESNVNNLSGIQVPNKTKVTARIDIKGDNGVSLCVGGVLSQIPSSPSAFAEFKFTVEVDGSKSCSAEGRTGFPSDPQPPTSLLTLRSSTINGILCNPGSTGNPLYCSGESGQISLRAWTIRTPVNPVSPNDSLYLNCRDQLRAKHLQPLNCATNPPQDYFSDAPFGGLCANQNITGANRIISDPGSLFLCRIGEANWFAANPDYWEPCERAKVWECSGGVGTTCTGRSDTGATVSISYLQENNPNRTSQYTVADIQLSNLRINRFYKYDVRAIDTTMRLAGPSFCSFLGSNLTTQTGCYNSGYGFAYLQSAPNITSQMSPSSGVYTSSAIAASAGGSVANSTAQTQFPGYYQCNTSELPSFSFGYAYTGIAGPWIYNIFGAEVCSSSNGNCNCTGTSCSVTDVVPSSGSNTITATVSNPCSGSGASTSFSWCVDDVLAYTFDVSDLSGNLLTYPPIQANNFSPNKLCGLVYYYPRIGGGNSYKYVASPGSDTANRTDLNWNDLRDSGCLAHTLAGYTDQQCLRVVDPCGREVNQTTKRKYQTLLALSTRGGVTTDHLCDNNGGGIIAGGNKCASGWCGNDLKCYAASDYQYYDQACSDLAGNTFPNLSPGPGESGCFYGSQTQLNTDGSPPPTCGTTYKCVGTDSGGNSHEETGLDISRCDPNSVPTPNACTISDTCTGGTKTCNGVAGGTPCSEFSWPSPCVGGAANCRRVSGTGLCQIQTTQSCTLDSDCAGISGICQVDQSQKCGAPTNSSLDDLAKVFRSPLLCPDLNSCGATPCNWIVHKNPCLGVCGTTSGTKKNTGTCPCDPTGARCNLGTVPNPNGPDTACTKDPNQGSTEGSFCGFIWQEQSRTACTGPCGDQGSQTITYVCKNSGGAIVDNSLCANSPDRPTKTVLCTKPNPALDENGVACSCRWDVAVTQSCRGECGFTTGTEQITSTCNGTGCLSSDGNFCGGVPKPASPRACIKATNIDHDGTTCSGGGGCRIRLIGYSGCSSFCLGGAESPPMSGGCTLPGCYGEIMVCQGECLDCSGMSNEFRTCWNSGGGCGCHYSGEGLRYYQCP